MGTFYELTSKLDASDLLKILGLAQSDLASATLPPAHSRTTVALQALPLLRRFPYFKYATLIANLEASSLPDFRGPSDLAEIKSFTLMVEGYRFKESGVIAGPITTPISYMTHAKGSAISESVPTQFLKVDFDQRYVANLDGILSWLDTVTLLPLKHVSRVHDSFMRQTDVDVLNKILEASLKLPSNAAYAIAALKYGALPDFVCPDVGFFDKQQISSILWGCGHIAKSDFTNSLISQILSSQPISFNKTMDFVAHHQIWRADRGRNALKIIIDTKNLFFEESKIIIMTTDLHINESFVDLGTPFIALMDKVQTLEDLHELLALDGDLELAHNGRSVLTMAADKGPEFYHLVFGHSLCVSLRKLGPSPESPGSGFNL